MQDYFWGFMRANGTIGVRNHLLIIPTSSSVSYIAKRIQKLARGSIALPHEHGGTQTDLDAARTFRVLAGVGANPNVGAVLIVGFDGEDRIPAELLAEWVGKSGKYVDILNVTDSGGPRASIERGVSRTRNMLQEISKQERQKVGVDRLFVGSKCGGSDATSGLVSNPALGKAMDHVVAHGGTVVFGETPEIIGAEHILVGRTKDEMVGKRILESVARWEEAVAQIGVDMRGGNPSPGNIAGGLTTLEEKSLGAISKAGSAQVSGVIEYGKPPNDQGLYFMDSPGNDIECVSGMASSGAQIVCFTTGLGTPTGSPVVPVIKLCANPETSMRMQDNIDIDVSDVLLRKRLLTDAGEDIYNYIIKVASGEEVKAEVLGHREFSINRISVSQ